MYFTNISDSELSQYHSLVLNDFKMTLTDVLVSDLFKVETIVSDSIFKVYPLFYCNEIKSNNYDDQILDNHCIICKKETDTILSFNTTKELVTDVDFGYSVYNGAVGFVVYCYDTNTNIPLSDIVLSVETSKGTFNIVTGVNGAITYNYNNETLISIKYGNTALYDVSNTSYIDYYGNGLISRGSSGDLTGTDLKLLFEDDTIVHYVNKNSLDHDLGTGLHTVLFEGTLTSIGEYAFSYCTGLQSISLPLVESIGDYAFMECTGLQSVSLPLVESIGDYAFRYCTGLTSVSLPSVTSIREYAFYYCRRLQSVSLPNSLTSIGNYVFMECTGLTSVSLPNSLTSIGDSAFRYCAGLTSVSLPNSLTSIGDSAFRYCAGLTSVSLPNSLTSIGNSAFNRCTGLEVVEFNWTTSETILTYKSNWFNGASSSFIFSIPPNTKSLYENKGYPSNRLIERSE